MQLNLNVNGKAYATEAAPGDSLLKVLRAQGFFGVKHGCETGECGACTVLLDGNPINSCVMLAAQAQGNELAAVFGELDAGTTRNLLDEVFP